MIVYGWRSHTNIFKLTLNGFLKETWVILLKTTGKVNSDLNMSIIVLTELCGYLGALCKRQPVQALHYLQCCCRPHSAPVTHYAGSASRLTRGQHCPQGRYALKTASAKTGYQAEHLADEKHLCPTRSCHTTCSQRNQIKDHKRWTIKPVILHYGLSPKTVGQLDLL